MTPKLARNAALSSLALAALLSTPAIAENTLSYNVGAVTDYRYRGISQSNLKPALQGGVDYAHGSGLYVGAWASTIKWLADGKDVELDIYGGYKGQITPGLGYDVGVLRYQYPGASKANTTEVYGALSYGMFTAKYSHATTDLFGAADSKGSSYLDLSANIDLGNGLSLVPHVGFQRVKNNVNYTDYALTLGKDLGQGLSASVAYIKTDKTFDAASETSGKNMGAGRLVAGIKYSF